MNLIAGKISHLHRCNQGLQAPRWVWYLESILTQAWILLRPLARSR